MYSADKSKLKKIALIYSLGEHFLSCRKKRILSLPRQVSFALNLTNIPLLIINASQSSGDYLQEDQSDAQCYLFILFLPTYMQCSMAFTVKDNRQYLTQNKV